ncbi:MAG: prolyl oligopeptidase family serine peptidase [Pseudomonadota bacterium]|nr:prolyl oligopeptidase family serine peptidase [Pseudomonadota bacterium]
MNYKTFLTVGLLLMSQTVAAIDYPEAVRGPVVDTYFGTKVADPYRWLEDTDSAGTRTWVDAQNAVSLPLLAALPEREKARKRLTELWNFERFGLIEKVAGQYFYQKNDGLQNQSALWVEDSLGAPPRLLLDPNLLAADGTVALSDYKVSPDGRWLAYATATAGSDWNEFRVRKVADARDSAEILTRIKFSGITWTKDSKGFFYSRYPAAPAGQVAGTFDDLANQKLYYHRVGTPQDQDTLVFETPEQPQWGFQPQISDDGRYLVILIWKGSASEYRVALKDMADPQAPKLDAPTSVLVEPFEAEYDLIGSRGSLLYFRTTLGVERGRIIAIDVAKPQHAHWKTIVAEQADTLQSARFAGDGVVALYMHDATSRLMRFDLDGKPRGEITLPGIGSIPDLSVGGVQLSAQPGDSELFYGFTSFAQPQTNYRVDLNSGESAPVRALKLAFDPADYVTEQVFYPSKDGTRIPMFISYRKGLRRDNDNPTHLHGYGGFEISKMPEFSVFNLVWMEMGGVYAQANLRGGGEYGRAWHEAGTLARKQNVFDDFAAAGKYLISNGWTRSQHLAISGRSNGGLLVGATMLQHPGLFAAAMPAVGVMDMLRYHKFTIGWAWAGDYGTAETKEGFEFLYPYSPVHNVRKGTKYPATLVTTADHDDRVVPGHSFKFAAALQHAQAGDAPVLIRIDVKAGHGAGKPVGKLIEEDADRLAFLRRYTAPAAP